MKKYKIVGRTNAYIARTDSVFRGKTEVVLAENLSLREAQKKLIDFFNEDYNTFYNNWGLIRCNYHYLSATNEDGTRSYWYDSRNYFIEEESEEEKWYCSSYSATDKNGEELFPDCDYFSCDSDEEAIEHAKRLASLGTDYADEGHVVLDLLSVCRGDPEREWEEVMTIWY